MLADGYRYAYVIDNGVRIGYLAYYVRGQFMILSKLYLLKQYRRKGKGTVLIEELKSIARECGLKEMFLRVNSKNDSAIAMYRRSGFEDVGFVIKDDGYDIITMRCIIS